MRRLSTTAYYAAQAFTVALVLFGYLQLWRKDLNVPFEVSGDALFWTVIVETVHEDGWGARATRLGMPVGADLMDWPMGMPFDFAIMNLLRALLGAPGAALNAYWLLSLLATGLSATLCLRWLRLTPALAFGLGTLYGLLPYGFGHHTAHIPLVFHFIPFIAFLALKLAEGDAGGLTRSQRLTVLAACALQGLSYIYYSFFACILLGAAALIGWLRTRQAKTIRVAALALALLCLGTLAGLAPSLRYWQQHGRNVELAYKQPAEADTMGLRIRHLLTPIPDHPIPALRRLSETVVAARFPGDGENVWTRLGAVGSVGFLLLLGFSVGASAGGFAQAPPLLRSAAALNLVALLLAQVGGFGSLFNVFVAPDIRVYSRIAVFMAFFSLVAVGVALSGLTGKLQARYPRGQRALAAAVAALLLLCVFDQVSVTHLVSRYEDNAIRFAEGHAFAARVESLLPRGAMVFQLPHTEVPVEVRLRPRMELYGHGWAFVHSRRLRWSWGGIRGRNGDWAREIAFLPPHELVPRLALAGFAGIWLDRFGYDGRALRLVSRLAEAAGTSPIESESGRFVLVSLVEFQHRLEMEMASELARKRREALRVPLVPRFGAGCDREEDDHGTRWCGPTSRLFLKNTLDVERRVTVRARFNGPTDRPLVIRSSKFEDIVPLEEREAHWERSLIMRPRERLRIDLSVAAGTVTSRLQVVDLQVFERGEWTK